jgi:GntR family transcriptional regulator, transcriptional repressor for pyruvate dehydrogenase complex
MTMDQAAGPLARSPGEDRPALEAIPPRRVSELVAEKLVEAIRNGMLGEGDRLPSEHELVRQLGVGRTSVREGLQKLEALGIITVQHGRGAYVARPDVEHARSTFARWTVEHRFAIEELVESRMALESVAAAAAAVRGSDEAIAAIEEAHFDHVAAGRGNDLGDIIQTDLAFHQAVMSAGGNVLIAKQTDMLLPELFEFRRRTHALPGNPDRSAHGHAAIVDAIKQRDAARARLAMVDHLFWLYQMVETAAADSGQEGGSTSNLIPREALG